MASKLEGTWVDVPLNIDVQVAPFHGGGVSTTGMQWISTTATLALLPGLFLRTNGPPLWSGLINMVYNKDTAALQSFMPLVANNADIATRSAATTAPRGIFYSKAINRLIEAWDQYIFVDGTGTNTTFTDGAAGGPVGFADGFSSAGTAYCFVTSQNDAVSVAADGTLTTISDGDYPDPAIPTPIFMDSYVFVAKGGTRSIYNSSPGDQTAWAASTFINTEETAGKIVGLAKHKKFIVALCEDHIEFFRDAATAPPNSPLARVPELTVQIGCANRATICYNGDIVYFIGRAKGSVQNRVYKIEDAKVVPVSNQGVENCIASHAGSGYTQGYISSWGYDVTAALATNHTTMYTTMIRNKPVIMLIIKGGTATSVTASSYGMPSFLYDIETGLWSHIVVPHQTSTHYTYGGLPMPFGCVYEKGSSTPVSVFISRIKANNSTYYLFDTSTIALGYYDSDLSTFNGNAAGWYGLQTKISNWGSPFKKFVTGLYLGQYGILAEPSATPFAATFYDSTDIDSGVAFAGASVPLWGLQGGSLRNQRVFNFQGGAHDEFGLILRFTQVPQAAMLYDVKLKISAGTA